jgi:tetratricopeptide (TPR) repeat protein
VLGLLDHYFLRYSFVGDHFQYLASIGPLALTGALMCKLPRWAPAIVLAAFGVITWHQQRLYRDPEVLWTQTLEHHPTCWLACNNLGIIRYQAGRIDEAIELWERALQSDPKAARTHNNIALALNDKGRTEEALDHYRKALRQDPDYAAAHANYGSALLNVGRLQEAVLELELAAKLAPKESGTWLNLGAAHLVSGEIAKAIADYEMAIQADAKNMAACNNLAWVLATQPDATFRDGPRAVELITRVMDISSAPSTRTLRTLAAALAESGDFNAAIKTATQALNIARELGDAGMVNALQNELAAYRQDTAIRYTP